MPAGYSFRPRAWPAALAAVACAAGIALGNWQAHRADERRAAASAHVMVEGRFLAQHTVYLGNRSRHGRPGYEVITPLQLNNGSCVLINRGWLAATQGGPGVATPEGTVRLEGVALGRLPHVMQAGEDSGGRIRQNLDIARYAAETGLPLEPRAIEQHSALADGLLREWPSLAAAAQKNEAYALQWYSLAALAVVLGIVFAFRRVGAR